MYIDKYLYAARAACATCALSVSVVFGQDVRLKETLPVAAVWTGQPVGFALLTDAGRELQYVGYYDENQNMVLAVRGLESRDWARQVLPSRIGWDSHNYITLALDKEGQLHVAGNMHNSPLVYFRTTTPGDVSTLARIPAMVGKREERMTYPQFINDPDGSLFFTYRDGQSGRGSNLYNRYDEKAKAWTRLIDTPLFDGAGKMSAYPEGPRRGPDGYWHMAWLWRDTPDAGTCHNLSYVRSRDLVSWETLGGRPVQLPITARTTGVIVDPIPSGGGIINGSGKLGFDEQGRVVIAYHKFDEAGFSQIYLARAEAGAWKIHRITDWNYRWAPSGMGAITFNIRHSGVQKDPSVGLYVFIYNARDGGGNWRLDSESLRLKDRMPDSQVPDRIPPELGQGVVEPLKLRTARDLGAPPSGRRYLLRWQTLAENGDVPREGPIPSGKLDLVVMESTGGASK